MGWSFFGSVQVQPRGEFDAWPLGVPVVPGDYFVVVDGIGINPEEGPGFSGDFAIHASFESAVERE